MTDKIDRIKRELELQKGDPTRLDARGNAASIDIEPKAHESQKVEKFTGIDLTSERVINYTMIRRLGLNPRTNPRKASDDASYTSLAGGMAKLLYPDNDARRNEAALAIKNVFKQMSDLDDPQSYNTAYTAFAERALEGRRTWKEARVEAYHRFVAFAAEMRALQQCCEQAIEAKLLSEHDPLAKGIATWDRESQKMVELLRNMGKNNPPLEVIAPPADTIIARITADAIPFAEREKPEGQSAAQKIIAEKSVPSVPDLSELKAALQNGDPDKPEILENPKAIDEFVRDLGSDQILKKNESAEHAKSLKKEVAKLRSAIGRVESGDAANLGALTSALEVLHTHAETLYETVRERQSKIHGFPIEEALPEGSGSDQIEATVALEKLKAALGQQKVTLASGRAVTE